MTRKNSSVKKPTQSKKDPKQPGVKRPTRQQTANKVARPSKTASVGRKVTKSKKPQKQEPNDKLWQALMDATYAGYSEEQRKMALRDGEIVAKGNSEYASIMDSPTQNKSDTFSLKHSSWQLYCARYWKYFEPYADDDNVLTFLPSNGAAEAEGSDIVLDPFPDSEGPSGPDEVPQYRALLTLLHVDSFDLARFEVPKKLDPTAWHQVRTFASSGVIYKTKIQFFSNDHLKFRVSKALLSQKFDLPNNAPQNFEFIGIRDKPEVKHDRSKPCQGSIEVATKGYIGNPPGAYQFDSTQTRDTSPA